MISIREFERQCHIFDVAVLESLCCDARIEGKYTLVAAVEEAGLDDGC